MVFVPQYWDQRCSKSLSATWTVETNVPSANLLTTTSRVVQSTSCREKDAIQRDLNKLEKWVSGSCMQLNKVKCKVQHAGQVSLKLGEEWIEISSGEKDLGVFMD